MNRMNRKAQPSERTHARNCRAATLTKVTEPSEDTLTLTASLRPAALDARRGIVRLHEEVISALGLRPGDPVRLTGRRTTAGIVARAEPGAGRGLLYADDLMLGNLGIRDGGQVTIAAIPPRAARRVIVAGPPEVTAVVSAEMLRLALLGKVVTAGDNVSLLPRDMELGSPARALVEGARRSLSNTVGMGWTTVLLTVTETDSPDPVIVTMDTVVAWRDGAATHSSATPPPAHPEASGQDDDPPVGVDDLAGMRSQAQQLTELLDLGFHHREVLERLGTSMSLGILITGPAGSGKSTLVRAVAREVSATVVSLWTPELVAMPANDALARLRQAAASVSEAARGVLLVSDVDGLTERAALLTAFRQIIGDLLRDGCAVICTSSRPEAVDASLRAPGVLEHQIAIPLPNTAARRDLLAVLTRRVRLDEDVRLDDITGRTPGFVAADLLALVREAGVRAAMRQRPRPGHTPDTDPTITHADFEAALEVVRPTSMADSTVEVSTITLDEVGDMAEVKQVLVESVLWPLTYPDSFERLGIAPPRGVLLYGPPGCGKTYLVRAVAGSGRANVLSVKGAELLSKWVGESERAVRELFRRARDAAPALIFLDEVDALAPRRGQATDGGTTDRVVASLLTELDGVEQLRDVVVVGATNRPDLIDPALLRPGRLERLVFVPPPDAAARAEILRAAARRVPLSEEVDLTALAAELEGFSSADCAALIREAALAAMRESLTATQVGLAHIEAARRRVRPSLDPVQVAALQAYAERHQIR